MQQQSQVLQSVGHHQQAASARYLFVIMPCTSVALYTKVIQQAILQVQLLYRGRHMGGGGTACQPTTKEKLAAGSPSCT